MRALLVVLSLVAGGPLLGGDYWKGSNVSDALWGFADLHAHPMNHRGFGGHFFSGPLQAPLTDCGDDHGRGPGDGVLSISPEMGHKRNGPASFNGWPTSKTLIHQQMHRDWLFRAWQGGLRVLHCDVGNSRFSAEEFERVNILFVGRNPLPSADAAVIPLEMDELYQFAGNNSWAAVALSSAQLRQIVSQGKLALVPGIELDEPDTVLGVKHWNGTAEEARPVIAKNLAVLYKRGVRHLFGVHILDTAFGGSAVNNALFDMNSYWVNGAFMNLTNGWALGARYRQDLDTSLSNWALRIVSGIPKRGYPSLSQPFAHVNARGLSGLGVVLLQEMMKLGMIIDIDHSSARSKADALSLAEAAGGYPLVASHSGPLALKFGFKATATFNDTQQSYAMYQTSNVGKLACERDLSDTELARIAALGGMVGLGQNTLGIASACDGTAAGVGLALEYFQQFLGAGAIAFGTDFNGLGGVSGARFGPLACAGAASGDDFRSGVPALQAAAQRRGVTYDSQLVDPGSFRFQGSGSGFAYSSRQRDVWEAAARFAARADLDQGSSRFIRRVSMGFNASASGHPIPSDLEGQCAWLAYKCASCNATFGGDVGRDVRLVWSSWLQFDATLSRNNLPLKRSLLGTSDRDINIDGAVHVGMLPDLLQDASNLGVDVSGFFKSAAYYANMWLKAEKIAAKLRMQR